MKIKDGAEELLSVGIDLGTSTTQLVFSTLRIENMASSYTIPKMVITDKTIRYKSDIYFTPLKSQSLIDFQGVKDIVAAEYQKAGIQKNEIDTGAVIITGETARKENAREVVNTLSGFAGDFVVATAGPDLESVISGKGAGTDVYTSAHHITAVNIDIGGGTSNLAVFSDGETMDTGCLDIGGRLIKADPKSHVITYIAPKIKTIIEQEHLLLREGRELVMGDIMPLLTILVEALEQSVGLRENSKYYDLLLTNKGLKEWVKMQGISFSGGVASILYDTDKYPDPFVFGDIGVLLARAIEGSRLFQDLMVIKSTETIRATVVGAGSHTTEISGSTITYTSQPFPIKNLPVLKLSQKEEVAGNLTGALEKKLSWFWTQGEPQPIAIAFRGEKNPTFHRIESYAREILAGVRPLVEGNLPLIVVVQEDMAKALGHTLRSMTQSQKSIVCLDSIALSQGDYIDVGKPIGGGSVLPVVVKTLVFQN